MNNGSGKAQDILIVALAFGGMGLLGGVGAITAGKAVAASKLYKTSTNKVEKDEAYALEVGNAIGAAVLLATSFLFFILFLHLIKYKKMKSS